MTRWWWRVQDAIDPIGAPARYRARLARQVAAFERIAARYRDTLLTSQQAIDAFRAALPKKPE